MKVCKICGKPHYAKNMCKSCYNYDRIYGTTVRQRDNKDTEAKLNLAREIAITKAKKREYIAETYSPKSERGFEFLKLYLKNYTLSQIGQMYNISRQRVHGILNGR